MPDDPASFVNGYLDAIASELAASTPDDALAPFLADAQQRLQAVRHLIASASFSDLQLAAMLIAANQSLFATVEQPDFALPSLDMWRGAAFALLANTAPVACAIGLIAAGAATGSVLVGALAAVVAVWAWDKLQNNYKAAQAQVFTTSDSISGDDRRARSLVVANLSFAQGQPGLLGLQATFRGVLPADIASPDSLVQQVAQIETDMGLMMSQIDAVVDPDVVPPLGINSSTTTRPLTANDVNVTGIGASVTVVSAADAPLELLVDPGNCRNAMSVAFTFELQVLDIDEQIETIDLPATVQCACGATVCTTDQTCVTCGGNKSCAEVGSACCGTAVMTPEQDCCGATTPPTVIAKGDACCATHFQCPVGSMFDAVTNVEPPDGSPPHCCQITNDPVNDCMAPYTQFVHVVEPVDHDCNGLAGTWMVCTNGATPRHCQP